MGRFLIFDTHPIQYRSPVFRLLYQRHADMKVWFFNDRFDGNHWWFHEVGKIPSQPFGVPLQDGFPSEVIGTAAMGLMTRWGVLSKLLDQEKPSRVAVYGYYLPEHWMLRLLCAAKKIPLIFVG